MARLKRGASGGRHVRWAGEIVAAVRAHIEINRQLTEEQKAKLQAELDRVSPAFVLLSGSVRDYRAYLDGAHVEIRAKERVANYLCDEAQRAADGATRPHRAEIDRALPGGMGRLFSNLSLSRVLSAGHERTVRLALDAAAFLRTLPPSVPGMAALAERLEAAGAVLEALVVERRDRIDPQRRPLKSAVERAIGAIREELEQMDGRLRGAGFPQVFIDSLYPELTRKATAVADDDADEDDDDTGEPNPK